MKDRSFPVSPLTLLAAAGAIAAASAANAQPQLINISGSTLLRNFITAPAATNDYIGIAGLPTIPPMSLTPAGVDNPADSTFAWFTNFRGSGSVNGFNELLTIGSPGFVTGGDTDPLLVGNRPPAAIGKASEQWANRTRYVNNGPGTGSYNMFNPGGQPYRAASNSANRNVVDFGYAGVGSAFGGVTMDIAYADIPTYWGLAKPGTPSPTAKPTDAGYGAYPKLSVGKDGAPLTFGNALPTLPGARNIAADPLRDTGVNPYNANTIFEIPVALAVVAPVTNYGTGITQMKMSEMRWLWATGRARNGENFVVGTRSIDSGTRNAAMNTIGLDPSWAVGDNVGVESILGPESQLGASFYPTNKGSTALMTELVKNNRLAVGYLGADGGTAWLSPANRQIDIIDTQPDVYPGGDTMDYVRPTLNQILSNNPTQTGIDRGDGVLKNGGWVMSGVAVMATIGDTLAEPTGLRTATAADNWGGDANGNPAVVNKAAAKYVNNIYRSILAFNTPGTTEQAEFSPGEFLATNNILVAAVSNIAPVADPLARVANNTANNEKQPFSSNANAYTLGLANQVFKNVYFRSFSTTSTGLVPLRVTAADTYSDKLVSAAGDKYTQQDGVQLSGGAAMPVRNKIAFDFDGNGSRTLADAQDMINAWRQRWITGNPVWTPSDNNLTACIEILGDADGNGSFDSEDVRYWADGLALVTGKLDRKAGFTAVDNAWTVAGGTLPFFRANADGTGAPTTLATGKPYAAGDARGDVIGSSGKVAPGWAPVGHDNVVDARDIDYVLKNVNAAAGSADWFNNLNDAVKIDLSCDMNGDLKVDQQDVTELVTVILGTCAGDVNLDGRVSSADRAIVDGSIATPPAAPLWSNGDVNGDGVVNAADRSIVCPADADCDGTANITDIFVYLNTWFSGSPKANVDDSADGVNITDIFVFLNLWFAGC